ncbi:hypothetical protein [Gloeocapsa sp. PCC 73106]|uniref:hypothetical protein n=1 Tax=Gloeocapsa sp. PCC 73106 TaxID=102232 RepID=UPI0002AC0A6A|nr:hypothetical protein [Gloeocapsa sp. PCC 73106]ELR97541.1 hypothetical protein GLO73106DRAFT_00013510 [Gloeocapsa sp. PCC 73106]
MTRYILLSIITVAILGIAPYSAFFSPPVSLSSQTKDIFDEIAEAGERLGTIDEEVENVRRAGEEFLNDVGVEENRNRREHNSSETSREAKERRRKLENRSGG